MVLCRRGQRQSTGGLITLSRSRRSASARDDGGGENEIDRLTLSARANRPYLRARRALGAGSAAADRAEERSERKASIV